MVVTICGSMKYEVMMKEMYEKLTRKGFVVFLPWMFGNRDEVLNDDTMEVLHTVHNQKILMSNAILVVDVGSFDSEESPYVGNDTKQEIEFAKWASENTDRKIAVIRLSNIIKFYNAHYDAGTISDEAERILFRDNIMAGMISDMSSLLDAVYKYVEEIDED